jgi:hypothetical protein
MECVFFFFKGVGSTQTSARFIFYYFDWYDWHCYLWRVELVPLVGGCFGSHGDSCTRSTCMRCCFYRRSTNKSSASENTTDYRRVARTQCCPNSLCTFVNFLLHSILPQDRRILSKQAELKDLDKVLVKSRKKSACMTTRVAQNGARLLWIWRVILAILCRRQCSSRRWKFSKARKIWSSMLSKLRANSALV